jgi:hypothetical protein
MWKDKFEIKDDASLARGVFLAFIILFFHVGMLLLVALLVVFFGFIVQYFVWIILGIGLIVTGTVFYVLYTMKKQSRGIAEVLVMPEFKGKNVELRLFGGLASLKITDSPESAALLEHDDHDRRYHDMRYLESPDSSRVRELTELARLLEKDLITLEEYTQAKGELFNR